MDAITHMGCNIIALWIQRTFNKFCSIFVSSFGAYDDIGAVCCLPLCAFERDTCGSLGVCTKPRGDRPRVPDNLATSKLCAVRAKPRGVEEKGCDGAD